MSNSSNMATVYKHWQAGERCPYKLLEVGKAENSLCIMMYIQRYIFQFEKGFYPNKVSDEAMVRGFNRSDDDIGDDEADSDDTSADQPVV